MVAYVRSGHDGFVSLEDPKEVQRRRHMLAEAKRGNEDALAELRDGWGLRTWVHQGRTLIREGVLVGVRR